MSESSSSRQHVGDASARPPDRKISVMRQYLESGVDFEWPEGVGKCDGNHCDLHGGPGTHIPLIWKSRISDKKASIDIFVGGEQYAFKEAFAVKTIREKSYLKSKTRARNEIESMKDLRHPHVAALLGTFTYMDRLSILIFPAAPCDLHVFLRAISRDLRDLRRGRSPLQELANQHARADTPESRSSTSSVRDGPGSPGLSTHSVGSPGVANNQDDWPMRLTLPAKVDSLRGYFVCLSQALNYIHENDVRHKDIKPENILIDSSGSVVLTDFGISRRFPKKEPHVTNDKWEWTRKYASPEIMRGKKVPRDDPSDVFSLGCVFLEMASLILGRDQESLRSYYAIPVNDSGLEDAYYCNLERVHAWIDYLKQPRDVEPRSAPDLSGEKIKGQDFMPDLDSRMMESLAAIRRMLDIEPFQRPPAKGLWASFQHVGSHMCRDCDPRLPDEIWMPNRRQKDAMESGTSRRRSMQLIPEEASDNPSQETRDGHSENEFLSANYRPDRHSLMGRRASSPHTGRRQGNPSKTIDSPSTHTSLPVAANIESYGRVGATVLPDDGTQIRRTTSATDGRRAGPNGNSAGSRSMSPKKQRPSSESRLYYGKPQASESASSALPPTRDRFLNAPSASRSERGHIVQNPAGSSPSLNVKKLPAKSDSMETQEKAASHGHSGQHKQEHLQPGTPIIIYDFLEKQAYVTAFAQLKGKIYGKDYISQPLPKTGQLIEIGEKGAPIAKVDLGSLGWVTSLKRLTGSFPMLFVLNFSIHPG